MLHSYRSKLSCLTLSFFVSLALYGEVQAPESASVRQTRAAIQKAETFIESRFGKPEEPVRVMAPNWMRSTDRRTGYEGWTEKPPPVPYEHQQNRHLGLMQGLAQGGGLSEKVWIGYVNGLVDDAKAKISLRKAKARALEVKPYREFDVVTAESKRNPELYAKFQQLPSEIEKIDQYLAGLSEELNGVPEAFANWEPPEVRAEDLLPPGFNSTPKINVSIDLSSLRESEESSDESDLVQSSEVVEALETYIEETPLPESTQAALETIKQVILDQATGSEAQTTESLEVITAENLNAAIKEVLSQTDAPIDSETSTVAVDTLTEPKFDAVDRKPTEAFKYLMKAVKKLGGIVDLITPAVDNMTEVAEETAEVGTTVINHMVTRSEEVMNSQFGKAKPLFESQNQEPLIDTELVFDLDGETISATVNHWRVVEIGGESYYISEDLNGEPSGILIRFEETPSWIIFAEETLDVYHTDPETIKKNKDGDYTAMEAPKKIDSIQL